MDRRTFLLCALFSASLFALTIKVLVPGRTYLVVTEPTVRVIEVNGIYTSLDVLEVLALSLISGVTGTLLMINTERTAPYLKPLLNILSQIENLNETERAVLREIVSSGGSIQQSELRKRLNIPKST